ncbi:lipid-A-disaccharide synthase [Litoreibacter arenae]|uniref:Lipid-A-disaccharide synthase n=1 Tax=Litoreibacter arenae DSM 19593 TaxID=1123360 RepID=S9QC84_9RHOB|nr:lipid-A-disaccharide synthase [Litoreibacter arenae]EPX79021.1 Lipid-A-disaccharide synthase [Litoreibacter arenae DSM 19593]
MKVYLIAGEPSGDKLGGALMEGLRQIDPDVQFQGVGGPLMEAQGMVSLFPMEELSVMGLAEVLPKLRGLFRRRDETVEDIIGSGADVVVTIDSPDFCLRVLRKLRTISQVPTVHYVAPSVWAWRPKRTERMIGIVDHVMALLPFEPPYMERAGLPCDFVGHPVVAEPLADIDDASAFRMAHGLGDAPVVLALPGSRKGEVSRLIGVFGESLHKLAAERPDIRVVVPAAAPVAAMVHQQVKGWPGEPVVLDPRGMDPDIALAEKRAAFAVADVALAASGTVSLELAANTVPMVIAYDMNWFSRIMIRSMLQIDTVTLVNLVSETRTVPEFLGEACKPDDIARALDLVLQPGPERSAQAAAAEITMERLGRGDEPPGLRAAKVVARVSGVRPVANGV